MEQFIKKTFHCKSIHRSFSRLYNKDALVIFDKEEFQVRVLKHAKSSNFFGAFWIVSGRCFSVPGLKQGQQFYVLVDAKRCCHFMGYWS